MDSHNERRKQATESEGGQPLQMNANPNKIWLTSEPATNAAEVQGRAVPPSKLSLGVEIGEIGIEQYSVLHLLYHSRTRRSEKNVDRCNICILVAASNISQVSSTTVVLVRPVYFLDYIDENSKTLDTIDWEPSPPKTTNVDSLPLRSAIEIA